MENLVEDFYRKYPFGEWEYVEASQNGIAYTGRQIFLCGNEIHMRQPDFIKGRMDPIPCEGEESGFRISLHAH